MNLVKYSIDVPSKNEDIVAAFLYDCDIDAIEIEDDIPLTDKELKSMFVDIPKINEKTNRAILSFYLDSENKETKIILKNVKIMLENLKNKNLVDNIEIKEINIKNVDWQNNWKKYFKAFNLDDIWIVPSWEEYEEYEKDDNLVIRMDPGSAFGTGKHETTRLCIKEIRNLIKNKDKVLDIGTGSGILGILAIKLGASYVDAIDIDKNVSDAVEMNLLNNNISKEQFKLHISDLTYDSKLFDYLKNMDYDIIIANILPDILSHITPYVQKIMSDKTFYILSGILDIKVPEVEKFLNDNKMEVIQKISLGEWVSITAKLSKKH